MRIGINCLGMNNKMGGLRQYGQRLIRELLDNDPDNSYLIFHSPENRHEIEMIGGERLHDAVRQVEGYVELYASLDDLDLYFCPFATLWPRPLQIPSVVNLSDIQEIYYPQFFTKEVLETRKRHYAPSTKAATCVLTVSEFSKQTIAEHHRISPDKIFVAYHCADKSMFEPPPGDALRKFDLPERFVFYPANFWQHKNHDALLRALLYLRSEKGVSIPCVLTGQEADNGYPLRKNISAYGLDSQVRLLGYVTNEEVRALFHRAELLCFPSLFEGFGMPLVDAMAAGLPIACSSAASIPEVVADAGVMFDPGKHVEIAEVILRLWNEAALRKYFADKGRERAKLFTAENMVKVHLQAFSAAFEAFDSEGRDFYRYEVLGALKNNQNLQREIDNCRNSLRALQNSLSWRITAPLRRILDLLKH